MVKFFTHEKSKVRSGILAILCILQLLLLSKNLSAQCSADATVNDTLTCSNATVTLNGSSSPSDVSYSWTGPSGYTSFSQNPEVSLPGEYVLTITTTGGGCTATDTVEVEIDTVQPDASAIVTEMINCSNSSVTLQAVTSIPDPSFWWIGPSGYTSAQQNPSTTVSGGYTLIVTDLSNGCASTATVNVEKSIDPPLVSAYVYGTLTCTTSSVQLTSSSPTPTATFSWSGPNGYSSSEQNPSVLESGSYTVTATDPDNTCTSTATVTVPIDTLEPGAYISASNEVITCTDINATLYGSSPTIGVNYAWSGPNGYTSTVQNPVVVDSGDYVLTITRVSTGCISRDTINIAINKDRPGATATPSGQITCIDPSITLQGSSSAPDVSYRWLASGFYSVLQNPTTSNPGAYLLTVTDNVNGCTSSTVTVVQQNTTPPSSVTATNEGPLTCTDTIITLTGNSSTSGVTYSWTGPNGWTSDQQNPTTDETGSYSLTVTDPDNGCTASAGTTVDQNITPPSDVTAGNNGPINCIVNNINLSGSTSTGGVTYSWTGPDSYSSEVQNPVVDVSGEYILKVTRVDNGCFNTASTTVGIDTLKPASVTADNNGPLTCTALSVNLLGSSSTGDVLYNWTGPDGYTSTSQNPVVSISGTYNLVVTNPVNNCTNSASTFLDQDTIKPAAVTATNDGPITCITTLVTLSGSSSTSDVTYDWSGPGGYTSTLQNPVIDTSGTFSLTVTDPDNGCSVTKITTVGLDNELPSAVNAVNNGPLTCDEISVTLTGSSVTPGVTYSWTGPNGFTSGEATPTTSDSGLYRLTVTDPDNGCFVLDSTLVEQDADLPVAVTATNNGPLTCSTVNITITGNSTTSGVEYSWTGPSGFVSTLKTPSVDEAGTYHLTVTDPTNGCYVLDSTIVDQDTSKPVSVLADNDGPLTCSDTTAQLSGSSSTADVSYSWTGPNGFSSFEQNPVIDSSGTYYLTVTNEINGCFVETSTIVSQNTTTPGVTAGVFDEITCEVTSVAMAASSSTGGVEYSWTGPEDYYSTEQNPSTTVPGHYTVTATNPVNGCTSEDTITVFSDTLAPADVIAAASDTLSCVVYSVTLTASSSTPDVLYEWAGPNGYNSSQQNPDVTDKGNYELTVTNTSNGCITLDSVTVQENIQVPQDVIADVSGIISCIADSVAILGSSTTPDVTYSWVGPGFTSSSQEDSVGNPGIYTLIVTDPVNGCTATDAVTVVKNVTLPQGISTDVSGTLTCTTTSVIVSASSTTATVEYSWTGPDDFSSNEQAPSVNEPGSYVVTITNTVNGCFTTRTLTVNQNISLPESVSASSTGTLTCTNTSVPLTGNSTTGGATFSWTGPGGFTSTAQNPTVYNPGDYQLVVTHPISGCTDTALTSVSQDITPPADVTATASSYYLNCDNPFVILTGSSSTPGVSVQWTGPGVNSNDSEAFTVLPGTFIFTATDGTNGCSDSDSVIISEDYTDPDLTAQGAAITCTEDTVTITASSTTPGVTYQWTGPGLIGSTDISNPSVDEPGEYEITVENPVNGCTSSQTVDVTIDTLKPDLTVPSGDTLTCSIASVTLTASSTTPGVIFSWDGFGTQNPIIITVPDDYTVTVLNPDNGCTNQGVVTIAQDTAKPDLSTSVSDGGLLTCSLTSVTLTGTTSTPNAIVTWTGYPEGEGIISVANPGDYYATALDTTNGCTRSSSESVSQNIDPPADVEATVSGDLTCGNLFVFLTGSTSTGGVSYRWNTGATDPSITVITSGDYVFTVTRSDNGCSDSAEVTVFEDYEEPVCNIITPTVSPIALQNNTISCQELTDVTYSWSVSSGTGWSVVSGQNTSELTYLAGDVGTSATISLTITNNGNGCFSSCDIELTAVAMSSGSEFNTFSVSDEMPVLVYPNPFSDKAWIEFTAEEDNHVSVEIYSLGGVLQKKLLETVTTQITKFKLAIDGSEMPNGTYYCIIKTDDNVYTLKIMLIK